MSTRLTLISWFMLAIAVVAWVSVVYGARQIRREAAERTSAAEIALTKANQVTLNQQIHSLAESTKSKREQLGALVNADVVSMIDTIDAVGNSAGINAKVSRAEASGVQQTPGGGSLNMVTFSIEGSGTYAQLVQAVRLYESLPLLSNIEQIEFQRNTSDWHMTVRIKVLTAATVSI